MNFAFGLHDPSAPADGFTDGDAQFFVPSFHGANPTPSPTPVVVPAEAIAAEAAISSSGSGGVGSVVAETSGGLTINLLFDSAATTAPASFRSGIEQAAAILSSAIT